MDLSAALRQIAERAGAAILDVYEGRVAMDVRQKADDSPVTAADEAADPAEAELPAETQKILFFVPYHISAQPVPGSRGAAEWQECKARMVDLAAATENASVVDFMIDSPITAVDTNYWDQLHFTVDVSDQVAADLFAAARGDDGGGNGRYRVLSASP